MGHTFAAKAPNKLNFVQFYISPTMYKETYLFPKSPLRSFRIDDTVSSWMRGSPGYWTPEVPLTVEDNQAGL